MKHIGIYPNLKKQNVEYITKDAIKWLKSKGIHVYIPEEAYQHLNILVNIPLEESLDKLDLVISFGMGILLELQEKYLTKKYQYLV